MTAATFGNMGRGSEQVSVVMTGKKLNEFGAIAGTQDVQDASDE
jgi:hypothetical protein